MKFNQFMNLKDSINDKHFEVIVKKMSEKVKLKPQETRFLPGELVDKSRFEDENAKVIASGEPALPSSYSRC